LAKAAGPGVGTGVVAVVENSGLTPEGAGLTPEGAGLPEGVAEGFAEGNTDAAPDPVTRT